MSISMEGINEQAALWILRSEQPDWTERAQADLEAWLNTSYHHRAAYLRLREGWRAADIVSGLDLHIDEQHAAPATPSRHSVRHWALAASLLGIIAAGSGFWLHANGWLKKSAATMMSRPAPDSAEVFATQVGGRAIIPLSDGSQIELNTDSAARVRLGERRREVWLERGEAYFQVAHRENVPFVVHAGIRNVVVLGTQFIVRRDTQMLTVAVARGRVKVDNLDGLKTGRSLTLAAGDIAIARGVSTLVEINAQDKLAGLLAWRGGMLQLSNTKLSDVIAEFNRYHVRKIVAADVQTANIRISGAFQLSNVDSFLRLLRDAYDLNVTWSPDEVKISQP